MKSVSEIASEIWPVLYIFTHFWENLTLAFDLNQRSRSSVWSKLLALGSLNVPSMKPEGEIVSDVCSIFTYFWEIWPRRDFDNQSRSSSLDWVIECAFWLYLCTKSAD